MRPRLHTWAPLFALATVLVGGCEGSPAERTRRTPRTVDATSELVQLDDADATRVLRGSEELIGGFIPPPAKLGVVRPPPPVAREPTVATLEPATLPDIEPPVPKAPAIALPAPNVPAVPPWYEPPPRGPHTTAINIALAVGAVAAGIGTTAAVRADGTYTDEPFALAALGVGAASFGTALVLYLTEPAPKPKAGTSITLGAGMLGVRGTF